VTFGLVLVIVGVIAVFWPKAPVFLARYRGAMPEQTGRAAARSARIGGLLVVAAGIAVILAS
jgi:hypothetical protein